VSDEAAPKPYRPFIIGEQVRSEGYGLGLVVESEKTEGWPVESRWPWVVVDGVHRQLNPKTLHHGHRETRWIDDDD
jgi:hypothetical protein